MTTSTELLSKLPRMNRTFNDLVLVELLKRIEELEKECSSLWSELNHVRNGTSP